MNKFHLLLLGTSLLGAAPAFAAIDPPAASKADTRIRSLVYDPNNPVEIYTIPGASLRIELGADETVVDVVVSDQDTIKPDPLAPQPEAQTVSATNQATQGQGQGPQAPATCDANLCRSVLGNFVYIKPIRQLDPQPLFIQTQRLDANGKPEMVPYTFELLTRPADLKGRPAAISPTVWGVKFTYPGRVTQAQAAAWRQRKQEQQAASAQMASLAHPVVDIINKDSNVKYVYRGSANVQPDHIWDDGRTTFLRYNGNRHVPNVYNQLPDGDHSIPAGAPEPDEYGTTLRIAHTGAHWYIYEGTTLAGCIFNVGPDPEGRNTPTVAFAR